MADAHLPRPHCAGGDQTRGLDADYTAQEAWDVQGTIITTRRPFIADEFRVTSALPQMKCSQRGAHAPDDAISHSNDLTVNTQPRGNCSIVDDGVDMSVMHILEHIGVGMHDELRSSDSMETDGISASMETDAMYMNAELCGNGSAEDDGTNMDAELHRNGSGENDGTDMNAELYHNGSSEYDGTDIVMEDALLNDRETLAEMTSASDIVSDPMMRKLSCCLCPS
ncbi:hypothetical protein PF007_g24918 [Phytophthora fragariae]|uniref:Uncharacterized protein n=1 Tax=Phytophthora fragariae TaxID=53985 RepID=A0A6A3TJ30_9STRA|nr:hypothetical protein PF003_g23612 [Phytophthora fragariae]KAE9075641.1 hypothetical protein PF007_g24918 [Phytophthora fragariae]KAE9131476.1 hypothetical protein PF006_g15513 [Phytophthora fragariae]KAE9298851.1 hypothetical protein PF001_g15740 [Phytophthora fragariae]